MARRRRARGAGRARHRRPARPEGRGGDAAPEPAATSTSTRACSRAGIRLLSKIPRLPDTVIDKIVERFGNLQKIMRATIDDLDDVEGVGEARARAIKEGLARLAETSILDRYS